MSRLIERIQGWLYWRRLGYHKRPDRLFAALYNPDSPRGYRQRGDR